MSEPSGIGPLASRANSLRGQVYDSIRGRLQRGEIGPQERLVDVDIAQKLGVSRMPVREALLQLMNEGYLVGTTRGFMVPTLTAEDITDIFEVRKLLEPTAAAHATQCVSAADIETLRRAFAQARAARRNNSVPELAAANILFRQTWLDAVPNRRLAATISRFADHVQVVRFGTLHDRATQKTVVEGLEALLDAFVRRDKAAAERCMAAFIAQAEEHFFAVRKAAEQAPPGRKRSARA